MLVLLVPPLIVLLITPTRHVIFSIWVVPLALLLLSISYGVHLSRGVILDLWTQVRGVERISAYSTSLEFVRAEFSFGPSSGFDRVDVGRDGLYRPRGPACRPCGFWRLLPFSLTVDPCFTFTLPSITWDDLCYFLHLFSSSLSLSTIPFLCFPWGSPQSRKVDSPRFGLRSS